MATLKNRLKNGEPLVGVSGPGGKADRDRIARILEDGPYDYIAIDSQHSPYSELEFVTICRIATELSIPVVARIMHTRQTDMIGKVLDLGASGIEVPQVNTPEEAADALTNFYYPPIGRRSCGGGLRLRAGDAELSDIFAYTDWWNNAGMLHLQLESIQAVTGSLLLAQPGVDCLSFGPSDLRLDMLVHPHPDLKTVDDCIRYVVNEIADTDTVVSFRIGPRENRQKYFDMGVRVLLESPRV